MPKWSKLIPKFGKPKRETQRPYFYLGGGIALTQLAMGPFVYVDPLEESVCPHLIAQGVWEAWIAKVVLDLLRPGDRVVEVGGHVGFYTLLMAQKVGPKGSVLSFEANPRLANLAMRSVRLNGFESWVQILQKAVSSKAGKVKFPRPVNSAGGDISMSYMTLWVPTRRFWTWKLSGSMISTWKAHACFVSMLKGRSF